MEHISFEGVNLAELLPRIPDSIKDGLPFGLVKLDLTGIVHSDPEIMSGTPVFVGTRVPVESLFDHLKAGDSIEVFLDGFPSVKREQVLAVLDLVEHEILECV